MAQTKLKSKALENRFAQLTEDLRQRSEEIVENKGTCIIVDDIIDSGVTIVNAMINEKCKRSTCLLTHVTSGKAVQKKKIQTLKLIITDN